MKTGTKFVLIFVGTAFLAVFVIMAAIVIFTFTRTSRATEKARIDYRKQTAATVGTLTNVSLTSMSKIYTYKYVVNGVSYSREYTGTRSKIENDYEKNVGKQATVCYDPSDPNNSDFKLLEILRPDSEKEKCYSAASQ